MRIFYLTTSSLSKLSLPKGTLKRSGRSDSIRSMGFEKDRECNVR
jgi:hypothetical protein